jgi:hypothetical protein
VYKYHIFRREIFFKLSWDQEIKSYKTSMPIHIGRSKHLRAGSMAQVIEQWPGKCKTLSSNYSTKKGKEKEKK